jgi:hypothetical protein
MNLEKGEVICDRCFGKGVMRITEQRGKSFYPVKKMCDKCHGDGKLDWIENIRGKDAPNEIDLSKEYYEWTWFGNDDDDPPYKRSSEEIKQRINPNYRKQQQRKNAYNSQRR